MVAATKRQRKGVDDKRLRARSEGQHHERLEQQRAELRELRERDAEMGVKRDRSGMLVNAVEGVM